MHLDLKKCSFKLNSKIYKSSGTYDLVEGGVNSRRLPLLNVGVMQKDSQVWGAQLIYN